MTSYRSLQDAQQEADFNDSPPLALVGHTIRLKRWHYNMPSLPFTEVKDSHETCKEGQYSCIAFIHEYFPLPMPQFLEKF